MLPAVHQPASAFSFNPRRFHLSGFCDLNIGHNAGEQNLYAIFILYGYFYVLTVRHAKQKLLLIVNIAAKHQCAVLPDMGLDLTRKDPVKRKSSDFQVM